MDEDTPSIAVLPFVNMSGDEDNEYFADGLAEELLNVLSKIRGLRVASRTSAFSFKGTKVDIPTVAQKLNVATVLEGSVRKAGNRVRVAAQLIQVATDSHLWSETYDRDLEDIFAVQDDIAQSVVKELRSALLGEKPDASVSAVVKAEVLAAAKGRGDNAKAYPLYLQGLFFADRITRGDLAKGIEYFRQAVELDPGFALAWAALSRAHLTEAGYSWAPLNEVQLAWTRFFSSFFRRRVSNGKRAAFVVAVFLVGIVERLEKGFLLVRVVLVGLGLRQVRKRCCKA